MHENMLDSFRSSSCPEELRLHSEKCGIIYIRDEQRLSVHCFELSNYSLSECCADVNAFHIGSFFKRI